jgi:hypothetical protein
MEELIIDSNAGIYVPKIFAENFAVLWDGYDSEDIEILMNGPDNEYYWEAWDNVLRDSYVIDTEGRKWVLYQDSDLWACTEECLTDEYIR